MNRHQLRQRAGRVARALRTDGEAGTSPELERLRARVAELESAVDENRKLNERLSDVLDVVVELLVPAVDRDDARLQEALRSLGRL